MMQQLYCIISTWLSGTLFLQNIMSWIHVMTFKNPYSYYSVLSIELVRLPSDVLKNILVHFESNFHCKHISVFIVWTMNLSQKNYSWKPKGIWQLFCPSIGLLSYGNSWTRIQVRVQNLWSCTSTLNH